jgi:NosR/NirI family nitrous oxide reductase transcriptional regulator
MGIRRLRFFLLLTGLLGVVGVNLGRRLAPEERLVPEALLLSVAPDADAVVGPRGYPLHWDAVVEDSLRRGIVYVTSDVVPGERGYAGPIDLVVGLDGEGRITGLEVLSHSETPSYVRGLTQRSFLDQFVGKTVQDSLRMGLDLDGLTGATITSDAVARTVRKSARRMGREILGLDVPETPEPFTSRADLARAGLWAVLLVLGTVSLVKRYEWLRKVTLALGLVLLGFALHSQISMINVANVAALQWPVLHQNISWFVLFGGAALASIAVGNIYCATLCPFAALQEFLYRLIPVRLAVPRALHERSRLIKEIIAWEIILGVLLVGSGTLCRYEPFDTVFAQHGDLLAWLLAILVLGSSVFIYRFWCRYFCGVGVILSLVGRVNPRRARAECAFCFIETGAGPEGCGTCAQGRRGEGGR